MFWSMRDGEFSFRDHLRHSYEQAFDVDAQYRKMADFSIKYPFLD
jgi:hypothetical protein